MTPAPDEMHLEMLGALHEGGETIVLLGPREPGFWPAFTASAEFADGGPDPLDRWSKRVIDKIAADVGAKAHYPFGGPPHAPFYSWALRSERCWASPVTLLVHARMGLFASFRGALALDHRLELPPAPATPPCAACEDKPCLRACPPRALTEAQYDVATCHGFLDTGAGSDCLTQGCAVRRACPVSQSYGRLSEQNAHHMRLFHT